MRQRYKKKQIKQAFTSLFSTNVLLLKYDDKDGSLKSQYTKVGYYCYSIQIYYLFK